MTNPAPLSGKVALITGSGQGIGKAIAFGLGALGSAVVLNGRDGKKLAVTASEIGAKGITVFCAEGDVTDMEVCYRIINSIIANFGRLDIVITNASMSAEGNFADMLPEVFRTSFNSLFFGSVFPVKAALPEIIKTRGHIVFISSLAGFYGLRRYSAYSSGKMALTALAQSIRAETANTGIHVGIAYVGLTQNEKSKTTLNADGELVLVPPRPAHLQQTREKVAEGIAKMILKRQKRKVFSLIGVIQDALIRFTPSLFRQIAKKL